VISPIQNRLDNFREQRRVKAGSLIISVFSDAVYPRGGRIWLGSLIGLLAPLQLNERLIRTSVFRLTKEAWLCSEAHGRRADYRLTATGQRRIEDASRHVYAANAPLWDRRWRLIMTIGELDADKRERLQRALLWQGFGALGADCHVHPSADLSLAFDALMAEGNADLLGHLMPLMAADLHFGLSASIVDMVKRAWNLDRLGQDYADFVTLYQPTLESLRQTPLTGVDDESAFLLRTLLIHDYRRLLLRDPELPEVLLSADWPGQQARLLCKEIYRRLLIPSERHLDQHLKLSNGKTPCALPLLTARFQNSDPLSDLV
jgi:phenylacetic acid degradation operon negative regulatory protein